MATRRTWAAYAGALALLVVIIIWSGSATASSPATVTFTGTVSTTGNLHDLDGFSVQAGDSVYVELRWQNADANLQLAVFRPDGTLLAIRHWHHHPKHVLFTATTGGTYHAEVGAMVGGSSYQLSVTRTPAPVAANDSLSTTAGTAASVNVLANDTDPSGHSLVLTNLDTPAHGTVVKGSGGQVTYTPAAGFTGTDEFGYTVCDAVVTTACSSAKVSVTVAAAPTSSSTSGNEGAGTALRWAPPALSDPITVQLPPTGDVTLNLDNSRDYIIKYPDVRRVGELLVRGGRNIVIVGGASTIAPHLGTSVRNMQFEDTPGVVPGRVIHIEGLDIDGSGGGQADGIGIATPSAIVQIENVRITGLLGHLSETHADVIQTWGGVKELRLYDVTGASHYNDLYLRRENSPLLAPIGPVILDHVNMFGYVNPGSWDISSTIRALSIGTQPADGDCTSTNQCGPANPDSSTNCDLTSPVTLSDFYGAPPGGPLDRFMWPTDYMQSAGCASTLSADGQSADWPTMAGSSVSGVMHLGPPPGGDFVPAGSVGVGYQSPGYQ